MMDPKQHALQILELPETATLEDIKESYHDLIHIWHPDRHTDNPRRKAKAEEKTIALNEAYQFLTQTFLAESAPPEEATSLAEDEAFMDAVIQACERHRHQWFKKGFDLNWHIQHRSPLLEKHYWTHMNEEAQGYFKKFGGKHWERLEPFFRLHIPALEVHRQCRFDPSQEDTALSSSNSKSGLFHRKPRLKQDDMEAYTRAITVLYDHLLDVIAQSDGTFLLKRR